MKWPLVWRAEYEHVVRENADLHARLAEEHQRVVDTLHTAEKNTQILLEVLAPSTSSSRLKQPLPMAAPQRDEISDAIELSAGGDRALARHLEKWAKKQRLDGMKEHDIIQSILHWRNAAEWDGDTSDGPESFL